MPKLRPGLAHHRTMLMRLTPLLDAPLAIRVHAFAAMAAFLLGLVQLARRKGDPLHGRFGRLWLALMLTVALSSFFIHEIRQLGGYSVIHLISVYVLVGLPHAWWLARSGRIEQHRKAMLGLFFGGLVVAGAFTLLPGRILHAMVVSP
jgi:uncharacterized membrane protein